MSELDEYALDELLKPVRWSPNRCSVAQAIEEIPDREVRGKVSAAADNPDVPAKNLATALKKLIGESPRPETIKRHQTRKDNAHPCTCPVP